MKLFEIGFLTVRVVDLIDIALVAFLIYRLYLLMRGSLFVRVLWLVLLGALLWNAVQWLDLKLLKILLDRILGIGAIALLVVFAPEVRKLLVTISHDTLIDRLFSQTNTRDDVEHICKEIVSALEAIRQSNDGALIVLTRNNPLRDIQETGDQVDAEVASRLIITVFQKSSPLHDGAMVIYNNRIAAVRCVLPISRSTLLPPELGMRHRAALGLTEQHVAMVVILSEERKELSIAYQGRLRRDLSFEELTAAMKGFFQDRDS